jgi:hypothetical protein
MIKQSLQVISRAEQNIKLVLALASIANLGFGTRRS